MDRGTAAYAVRRRTARPECNDGRLLSREDWEDCEVIARPPHGWHSKQWQRGRTFCPEIIPEINPHKVVDSRYFEAGDSERRQSKLQTMPFPSTIWMYRFEATLVNFSMRLLGAGQWTSSSSI